MRMKITDTVVVQLAHWCEFWKSCAGKLAKSTSQVTSKGLSWSVSYGRHAVRARVFAGVGAGTVTVPEARVQACVEAGVEFAKALFTLLVLASTTCCSSHFRQRGGILHRSDSSGHPGSSLCVTAPLNRN